MADPIQNDKYVELHYKVIDSKTGDVLSTVEFPLGYVHGMNDTLSEAVTDQLEGKMPGDIVEIPIDGSQIYGERDESLVFIDHIENVPEDYRQVGLTVTMENEKGDPKNFIVTRVDEKSVTIDGNHPYSGREVTFILEVLNVREPTDEEFDVGGAVGDNPSLDEILN